MKKKIQTSKRKITLLAIIFLQFANIYVQGQSWSIEYILDGDSSIYTLSQNKIIQGKPVDFLFPAYKYYQSSTIDAIESERVEDYEIIEIEFDSTNIPCHELNFEIDLYVESIDLIQYFLKTKNDSIILLRQNVTQKEYKYLPTTYFTVDHVNADIKSIQIVGKSTDENRKLIVGRLNGFLKIWFTAENMFEVDSIVSNYPFENHSETLCVLPDFYQRFHGFGFYSNLVLKDCYSVTDSIQCISQFTDKILNDYGLYDVYGIDKKELINRNALLTETSNDIDDYYRGMKEIIASLNSCHMRLYTSKDDVIESPLQPVYFFNINNAITVTAIFDPTLENKIQLGDRLLSINDVSIDQLYKDFSKTIFASTSHQREIKITQKLLHLAMERWRDSLVLELQNADYTYVVGINKSNFTGKKMVPEGFKIVSDNTIEKYNNIIYFKPIFQESIMIPFIYSHREDFNNCEGLIIDFRGCSGGDHSFNAFFSYLIAENSLIVSCDSNSFHSSFDMIVKPSNHIHVQAPIIVLIDSRTTCYPELLINALRNKRTDIYVFGASNTSGSAQLSFMTVLPKEVYLTHFEGLSRDANGKLVDDNYGIAPNDLLNFDTYKDLFPYDDKLKNLALKYLGYSLYTDSKKVDNETDKDIGSFINLY